MRDRPATVGLARILLTLDSFLCAGFAVLTGVGSHPSFDPTTPYRWPATLLALLVAALLCALAVHLGRPSPLGYRLGVGFLAVMILGSFFDQVGLADLFFVAAIAFPLLLLVKDRTWYLSPQFAAERGPGA